MIIIPPLTLSQKHRPRVYHGRFEPPSDAPRTVGGAEPPGGRFEYAARHPRRRRAGAEGRLERDRRQFPFDIARRDPPSPAVVPASGCRSLGCGADAAAGKQADEASDEAVTLGPSDHPAVEKQPEDDQRVRD